MNIQCFVRLALNSQKREFETLIRLSSVNESGPPSLSSNCDALNYTNVLVFTCLRSFKLLVVGIAGIV